MAFRRLMTCTALVIFGFCSATLVRAQNSQGGPTDEVDSAHYSQMLSSPDPVTRQTGAEALARLAAVDQKKMVEGYALQEKDKRVKLALNWCLYRFGKSEALFPVVRDLDSNRHDQAAGYLAQLESPEPLYLFLRQDNTPMRVKGRVIEVLGQVGNSDTLAELKPFTNSFDPKVATAAQTSISQIEQRLSQPASSEKTRPRVAGRNPEP